ncbi:NAD-dependent epimerase/dehydratase family protein [Achromobacter xylosoxidans]
MAVRRDRPARTPQAMHADAPIALFDACAAAGVRRVVQISALGIAHSATRYASTKRAADEHLLALTEQGRLNGCVLRPSVVFGAGGASSQLFLALARLPALLLPRAVLEARGVARGRRDRRGGARGGFGCAVGPGRDRANPRPCRWRS